MKLITLPKRNEKYRVIQDSNYQSDFDELIIEIKRLEGVEDN